MKEYLSNKNVEFTYIDITESMKNLKGYLVIRDTHEKYAGLRGRAMVGIPMIKMGDEVILGPNEDLLNQIVEQYNQK